jgi:methylenetetrahydrofolate dehydrogenase (NADP+) / methenyltetrahydrofolate cyclohydrolase
MSNAKIIDGKALAAQLDARVAAAVAGLGAAHDLRPGIAVVLVGDDAASQVYVRNKGRRAEATGMVSVIHRLPSDTTEKVLLTLLRSLNDDQGIHGILVQLPLPDHIDAATVLATVDPAKDVDGFHVVNAGRLMSGNIQSALVPCTPKGCVMLIKTVVDDLSGLDAVVVGRSNIVGKPVAHLLLAENCTVTIAHSRTCDLAATCRRADIVVAAVGKPMLIQGDWIKPGATVIDVGINRQDLGNGKTRLVGDVDFDTARKVAGAITPVPGGVGPMTIGCLLHNTLIAACRQHKVPVPVI